MQNMIVPFVAVISIISAGMSGVNLFNEKTSKPLIEGWAERLTPVAAGEQIRLEWTITKRTDCNGRVGRVWEGQDGFMLTEAQRAASLPKTDVDAKYRVQTQIPNLAPTGELKLTVKGYYDCPTGRRYWELDPVQMLVAK